MGGKGREKGVRKGGWGKREVEGEDEGLKRKGEGEGRMERMERNVGERRRRGRS